MKVDLLFGCAVVLCYAISSPAATDKSMSIPLKSIWAYGMPRTSDVRDLEPGKFGDAVRKLSTAEQLQKSGSSHTSQILETLQPKKPGEKSREGFIVPGTAKDALREAHQVLAHESKPRGSFAPDGELTAVFFSHQYGYYVHIKSVERTAKQVTVSYSFVPHETRELTRHFALIPIGTFPAGKVDVRFKRAPMTQKLKNAGFTAPDSSVDKQIVAQSFKFVVENEKSD